ncbi:hypothetical protein N7447_003779 [Penicillium robsamsonii]|uniref:uncharacterized protein n=1 Tax=Penicillium robsamsonii TaxID=1792511 RepID=UPI002546E783|nr:uncharacterized protein N7447_003779 [Penicillium robsamsonii]KAJ5827016.1 hypothetical protein N7447_003779 [Penicillium robsamsonii]
MRLPDGRTLGYAKYGRETGYPLMFIHGYPQCRFEASALDHIFRQRGIRVIAPERPGFGLSTVQPNRRIMDWPADVQELAHHLSLSRFAIMGSSGGGPYALANGLNTQMATRRVNDYLLKDQDQHEEPVGERRAQLLRVLFKPFAQSASLAAYEAKLLSQDWGIEFGDITYNNLHIWHVGKDWNSPLRITEYYVKRLSNSPFFTAFEGDTHFTIHRHLDEILSELILESS